MSLRYLLLTELLAAAGAFIVVVTFAFGGSATAIAFAVSIATLVAATVAVTQAPAARRRTHRLLSVLSGLISAWTILVSLGIFSGGTQRWLIFAGGAAIATLAVVARVTRELDDRAAHAAGDLVAPLATVNDRPNAVVSA